MEENKEYEYLNWKNSKISHFDDTLFKEAIFQQSFWSAAKTSGNQS